MLVAEVDRGAEGVAEGVIEGFEGVPGRAGVGAWAVLTSDGKGVAACAGGGAPARMAGAIRPMRHDAVKDRRGITLVS